ncbi:uncharacterized protein [Bemisia tabaci]|uniref:uncharacterized protein n=1 Tax=Bemisia tabaci TaxID=7038 RepID=UPI003B288915
MMEVVSLPPNGGQEGPRKRHNVAEWSRMDHLTGMLEHARVETDHWTANTPNTTHQFGKVVDRRARNRRDGSVQQVQSTKQLEVFQAHIPGGSVQVIRSQTSSWSNTKQVSGGPMSGWPPIKGSSQPFKPMDQPVVEQPFEDLQLSSSPLDLTPQKMKVNIGRSGSIGGRRPPTRPRSTILNSRNIEEPSSRLSELSSICEKLHRQTETHSFGKFPNFHTPSFGKRMFENGFHESTDCDDASSQKSSSLGSIKITEITNGVSDVPDDASTHGSLTRQKSNSIEDMKSLNLDDKTSEDGESNWRRGSKVRRSLQFFSQKAEESPKPNFKQVHTKTWSDLNELEGVVLKIKRDIDNDSIKPLSDAEDSSKENTESRKLTPAKKKDSFITVESLNEVRGKLKPLNPEPVAPIVTEPDDGVVTETKPDTPPAPAPGKVKSFVFGMEIQLQKPKINGTGSLESRSSSKSSTSSGSRSEEWYNRRKSYGFEQMHNQNGENSRLKEDSKVESSTDSGICRSSEIVAAPSKLGISKYDEVMPKSILDTQEDKFSNQFGRKTTVLPGGKIQEALRSLRETSTFSVFDQKRKSEPVTISIPIVQVNSVEDTPKTKTLLHRQFSNGTAVSVESSPAVDEGRDSCRESDSDFNSFSLNSISDKLSTNSTEDLLSDCSAKASGDFESVRPTSVQIFSDEDAARVRSPTSEVDKKQRKVEFSKTEIHFAAEPGKLNIVETDGKPPPTNIYRRRRRHSRDHTDRKTSVAEIRFGDSQYEKELLTAEPEAIGYKPISVEEIRKLSPSLNEAHNKIIDSFTQKYGPESTEDAENPKLRSILKNHDAKSVWCSSVNIKSDPEENEFQRLLRSLKPATRNSIDIPEVCRSTSTAADNGLEVRISSMKPVDKRRASWSVPERQIAEDSRLRGFSTKVNFGAGEATVVPVPAPATTSAQKIPVSGPTWFQSQSYCDNRLNNPKCQEKLIVRIGEGSSEVSTSSNLPKFSYSFNRIPETKANNYQKICDTLPECKSASLVMETMRSPTMQNLPETSREPCIESSTSREATPLEESSGIPSVLSVLDDLKKTIDDDIVEITRHRKQDSSIFRIKNVFKASEEGTSLFKSPKCDSSRRSLPSQLSLLKEILDLDSGELSDDSLKADEEVRSYMSQPLDEDLLSSEISGSWSRVKAFKYNQKLNLANKLLTTQNGDDKNGPPVHRVVAVAKLDSYDRDPNLNAVEALVSTKSGHPKITSISLKYDEDPAKSNFKPLNFSSRLSKPPAPAPNTSPCRPPKYAIPIPVIVERKSATEIRKQEEAKKKVLKSVPVTKMPTRQPAVPPRKVGPSRKMEEVSALRHRSLSPTHESSFAPLVPRATKSQEKVIRPELKPVDTRVRRERLERRVETSQRRSIFDSGRDSWLNAPKGDRRSQRQPEGRDRRTKKEEPRTRLDSGDSILEELTKAADEILLAVNGCTDDESRASSDDERKPTKQPAPAPAPLAAIAENPPTRRLRTAERSEARLKSRAKPSTEPTKPAEPSRAARTVDERNRRRLARVSLNRGHVASSSEDIESAAENAANAKMKRVVRRVVKSQPTRDPVSSSHKPRERVYRVDHPEEEKKIVRSSTRENGLRKVDYLSSSAHRRKRTSETVGKPEDLRNSNVSHLESRKESHRTVRGSSHGQKCDSRIKIISSSNKSRIIPSSK